MKYALLSRSDLNAIDALKEHHGGAQNISETLRERRQLKLRSAFTSSRLLFRTTTAPTRRLSLEMQHKSSTSNVALTKFTFRPVLILLVAQRTQRST